jgi:molybdopterin synthase catalytic subunit
VKLVEADRVTEPSCPQVVDWITVGSKPLDAAAVLAWATGPECAAVVSFCGTVRGHSEGRARVTHLAYEAYEEQATFCMNRVASGARQLFDGLLHIALHHRVGELSVGEISVLVVVSSAHRAEGFEAGRFCIDEINETVPIWKRETWADGSDWSASAKSIRRSAPQSGSLRGPQQHCDGYGRLDTALESL